MKKRRGVVRGRTPKVLKEVMKLKRKTKLSKENIHKRKDNEEESQSWGEDFFFSPNSCGRFSERLIS
jgi:hypothetical protein